MIDMGLKRKKWQRYLISEETVAYHTDCKDKSMYDQ